jgi:integrase
LHFKENEEIVILTPDQILALFDAASDLKHRTLFMTAAMTGMREGEILGLKWDDIDWVASQLYVKRTYNHGRFYEPKSKTSKRKIDLTPQLITQLKEWQLACPPNELDLVFPTREGKPIDGTSMVRNKFLPTLKWAGIPKIRFHDLRHTYASLLIDQGEQPKYIQTQMGHSSINITFDIYGHLMRGANEEAARKLGDTIFGKKKKDDSSNMVAE